MVVFVRQVAGGQMAGSAIHSSQDRSWPTYRGRVKGDVSGHPNIIYTAGDLNAGVNLYFTKRP